MKRARPLLLLLALLYAPGLRAQSAPPSLPRKALARAGRTVEAARVEPVPFLSKLVGAPLHYKVVLPPGYDAPAERTTRYPVLYLLHGLGGSYSDWTSGRARLAEHAARHRLIIVTPEGRDGWYTDSATVPSDKFETYLLAELIPDAERRYRALGTRDGRAVAGLSMGGYGALKFGLKHPHKFAFAASMSGALRAPEWDQADAALPAWLKPSIARAYGALDSPARRADDLEKIVGALPDAGVASLPFLYLDCGTEDFLIDSNRALAELLLKRKIPHEYRQLPGGHTWPYWDSQVQVILELAARKLSPPQTGGSARR